MKNSNSPKKIQNAFQSSNGDGKAPPSALEARLAKATHQLNARRQRLIRAILDSADETCFLSSREIAKRYHVDATTILRTTQVLGYESFADFAADLRQHFVARITPYTALKAATQEKRSVADHIDHSLDKAIDNLNILKSDLDRKRVIELAKLIKRSRHILVVGLDFAASLSYYLAYGLLALGAKKQGVPTFGITDSTTSPIARYCDAHLITPVVSPSFLNSYVGPMAAISAIHVACAHIDPKRSLNRLRPTDREYASGHRWYREPKGFNGDLP